MLLRALLLGSSYNGIEHNRIIYTYKAECRAKIIESNDHEQNKMKTHCWKCNASHMNGLLPCLIPLDVVPHCQWKKLKFVRKKLHFFPSYFPTKCSGWSLKSTALLETNQNRLARSVVLKQGRFCLPGEVGQSLDTFGIITVRGERTGIATSMWWVEARDEDKQPANTQDSLSTTKNLSSKASVMPRLRNTGLSHSPAEVEFISKLFIYLLI